MKRFLLLTGFISYCLLAQAQTPYNNEWIDFNKTYYKFKVGHTGLYRISQPVLAAAGIGNTPAEHFQLWRNGLQVPLHTSVPAGLLGAGGYIEFWGINNDGKPDSSLYREPASILSDRYSLQTDTAAYFLTINTAGNNLRLQNTVNNVAGYLLPPEPYFMFTEGKYFKDYINPGYYIDAGEYVHSSAYDRGEGWVGWDIYGGTKLTTTIPTFAYSSGPNATFRINLTGNGNNQRKVKVRINGDSILGSQMDYLNYAKLTVSNIPVSLLNTATANVEIENTSSYQYDRMAVAQYELDYPRVFNFGGLSSFEFNLPANIAGNYLEISNFNYGTVAPVLYDITNGKRYIGDISNPVMLRFSLDPSAVDRKLILISLEATGITAISSLQTKNFQNLSLAANQGDYLIISNSLLFTGPGGSNPVENYKTYRSSAAGGSFTAKNYDIDELVDQFAFGIKKHPLSIRNFLRWARANFPVLPKFVLLMGHAVIYDQYQYYQSYPDIERLNLVPTFGHPASDVLLSADVRGQIPQTPIGRLSVINGEEVAAYLAKVIEYEAAQAFSSPLVQDKAWMKNVIHVVGGSDPVLVGQLSTYMNKYRQIITDTSFGAKVTTFKKTSADVVQQLTDADLQRLLDEGINQLVYFGHSSATVLDFNLDDPEQYNNQGKYPFFIAMGCLAGNFFNYNPARFYVKETLSEKWNLTPHRGSIAFLATSHFGIPHYLDIYNTKTYTAQSRSHYGKSYGEILKESITQVFNQTSQFDYYARLHTEQNTFHGDPAVKPNTHLKADYVVEEPMVKVSPSFISIAEREFKVDAKFLNIGKAVINNEIAVEIKRRLPDGSEKLILKDTIPPIRYQDSISVIIPINPTTDKGLNKIIVTIDADNTIDELYETNNTVTKEIFIFENDARPVYPLNFAIINKQGIKLKASTANPFAPSKQYRMEFDTTTFFNSPFKKSQTITSVGGLLEFDPGVTFTDSTVYYWRVSPDSQGVAIKWNEASFVYLPASDLGFNQSHFFQHTKSSSQRVHIDSADRKWKYKPVINNLFIRTAIYPTGSNQQADYTITVNGEDLIGPGCNYNELIINVIDPITFKPWKNISGIDHGSSFVRCGNQRDYNFHFFVSDTLWRRKAQHFLENIVPDGAYVAIRSNTSPNNPDNVYAPAWRADTAFFGPGNSLYHTLKNQGFADIDMYDTASCFALVYKKNSLPVYTPTWQFSQNIYDRILLSVNCPTPDTLGYTTSPSFGRAKQWKQLKWRGNTVDATPGDFPTVDIIGIRPNNTETTVMSNIDLNQQDVDISSINAVQYPYVKLRFRNLDSIHLSAYQLRYWRLTYVPVPEGAIAPNIFLQMKDTLEAGEPLDFKLAFKNISEVNFDSLKVTMLVTDRNNVTNSIPLSRFKPLAASDTVHIRYPLTTTALAGQNTFYVEVNPDEDQPEQFHFNNFMWRNFYVKTDNVNPLLDITFDGVHILNRDIVASKPRIVVKLKDESKWLILNDTAGTSLKIRYPNGIIRPFFFNNNDTLKFTPAGTAPNPDNTATIDFTPYFTMDGDYELIVSGRDRSGNTAGNLEYKVGFQVINKPMISNMLNYPNPFTTSTAFVFTITGAEVPQNIKIQIMTITGKIVREITKDELGHLHVGRNITEFKWDGTDQYGQKLANGIYLYRVVTNLNGKTLDKYKAEGDETDKYFNKGYGKMYLMR